MKKKNGRRNVKFATNDPNNKSVELGIHATVK